VELAEKFSNARGYELQLGRWSSALASRFIEFAGIRQGDRVLDIGSGTGSLALAVASSTACAEIVGIDPSAPYIEFARSRTVDSRVRFDVGDAKNLPYADGVFDNTLAQLALNQIPDAGRAVLEMRRVTKAGGTVAACVWSASEDNERNHLFWNAAIAVDPAADRWREPPGDYGRGGALAALWKECGLREIRETELVVEVGFSSFDDFWLPHLEGQAQAGAYVKSLSPERQLALRERLRQEIAARATKGAFSLRAQAVAVRGTC